MTLKVTFAVAAGTLVLAGMPMQATTTNLVQTLDFNLTARLQGPTVTNLGTTVESIRATKMTTHEIIRLLGQATTNAFSPEARLLSVRPLPDGPTTVEVRDGTNRLNVGTFFTHTKSDPAVEKTISGRRGFIVGLEYAIHNFALVDAANFPALPSHFSVSGLAIVSFEGKLNPQGGVTDEVDQYSFVAAGTGDINGHPAVISGQITGKGKELEIQ